MNKIMIVITFMFLFSFNAFSQSMTIDEAIQLTATEIGQRLSGIDLSAISLPPDASIEVIANILRQQLGRDVQIAVLNFSSRWHELSEYVVDEMNNAIVRNGLLTVVERQRLDLARQELNFGLSGEVSDESAQRIGQFLGAQLVLTGSFTVIGGVNRFRIQVITVETGVIVYSNSLTIENDRILNALTPSTP